MCMLVTLISRGIPLNGFNLNSIKSMHHFQEEGIRHAFMIRQCFTYLEVTMRIITSSKTCGHLISPIHNGPRLSRLLQFTMMTTINSRKSMRTNIMRQNHYTYLQLGVDKPRSSMAINPTFLEVFKKSQRN